MKAIRTISGLMLWFLVGLVQAQPGLKGEYYVGTNFEQKVFTRIDPAINFSWFDRNPAPGMPKSYYSIRWTGKLLAPTTGRYTFSARVDDGIRIWIGNQKIMDSWQLNDSKGIVTSIGLEAGHFYDLRVDYFNDMLEGEITLFWQRPNEKKLFPDQFSVPREPITAHYFFQKSPPVAILRKPTKPASITPTVAVSTSPKALPKKRLVTVDPKLVHNPPPPKITTVSTITIASPAKPAPSSPTESKPELTPGQTFVLRNVQFEQSSYVLLPASSAELDNVVQAMKKNPLWHINVAGHTDNVGDPRLNLALSEQRAKIVANYLSRHGVADDRITATGFGGTRPIADNAIETERSKNRRVEITIR